MIQEEEEITHLKNVKIRRWKFGLYELLACGIILFNACLRFTLIELGWPLTNSDEATVGLMARHIAYHGELPIFFYGQGYMGSLEAYVGATLFPLFGPTVLALRIGVLLLFTFFLVVMYLLTSLLYNKKLALITLALLILGSPEVLMRETQALAGHPETPLFCAAIVLLTTLLVLSAPLQPQYLSSCERRKRLVFYSLWGLLVGAALWNDPLAWSYILLAGVFLVIFCRHELRRQEYFGFLLSIFITGIIPTIIYNLTAPITQTTFSIVGFLIGYHSSVPSSILDKLAGAILVGLPTATGANAVCTLYQHQAWPLDQLSPYAFRCTVVHGVWGLVIIALWSYAFFAAIRAMHKPWYRPPTLVSSLEERREAVLHFARVVMLGGAGLSFIVFTLSAQSVILPSANSRYLVVLAVALPAMFWPLWENRNLARWTILAKRLLICAILLTFAATLAFGTVEPFWSLPSTQAASRQQNTLVDDLLHLHATRIYTDYWTCDLVAFLSREQIICAVLDESLQPDVNRYPPYESIVDSAPDASYVFRVGSPQSTAFAQKITRQGLHYQLIIVDNYDVYQPQGQPQTTLTPRL